MTLFVKRFPLLAAALGLPLRCCLCSHRAPAEDRDGKAKAIAPKAAPGKIVEADFEKENGGWRYSFDIRQGNRTHEIGVDAYTGKIVESTYESAGAKD